LGLAAFFLLGQLYLRKCRLDFFLRRLSAKPSGKLLGDPLPCTPLFPSHEPYSFLDQYIPTHISYRHSRQISPPIGAGSHCWQTLSKI